jgi:hypothetical protein
VSGGELKLEAVRPAYTVLDAFHHGSVDAYSSVTAIIEESRQLQELQDLFELYVSDYLVLQRCSEELLYLKSLWDMVSTAGLGDFRKLQPASTEWSIYCNWSCCKRLLLRCCLSPGCVFYKRFWRWPARCTCNVLSA